MVNQGLFLGGGWARVLTMSRQKRLDRGCKDLGCRLVLWHHSTRFEKRLLLRLTRSGISPLSRDKSNPLSGQAGCRRYDQNMQSALAQMSLLQWLSGCQAPAHR